MCGPRIVIFGIQARVDVLGILSTAVEVPFNFPSRFHLRVFRALQVPTQTNVVSFVKIQRSTLARVVHAAWSSQRSFAQRHNMPLVCRYWISASLPCGNSAVLVEIHSLRLFWLLWINIRSFSFFAWLLWDPWKIRHLWFVSRFAPERFRKRFRTSWIV